MIIRPQSAIGGIGVWDCTTGEQADFFYEPPGCALGDADKLQWLDGTSTLMAATMFLRTDTSFIILLDFRDKKNVAWLWSDVGTPASLEDKNVLHAIAMEDGRCARPLSPAAVPRAATLRRRARHRVGRLSPSLQRRAPCSAAGRLTQVCHHACSREERKKRKRKDVGPTPPRRRLAVAEPSKLGPAAVAHSHLCSAARKKKGKKR
ncbi:Os06g0159750 [Oryza sativa Japonica Group]|uniref:Os06g0159750 protein n=1 Tax=Oryza sativa subsp. japonica TaxID=39947 RepID=A0A0P0WSZ7_ORYSJ|nr:Os06g0159750 [Oryza sativa Japonica Group]